ncbi:MAG TPA: GntR family transcriptional regulator [Caulobacteraceae bacterium]|jgi:DNA-binding GntR family transcriptional regulator|nr:GntR family transcriptional regulator [Caulobacteraceae bacterium]
MARRAAQIKLQAIEHDTLHGRIYQELRKALMSGAVQPGQSLSYRGLADALGTSPMPVRDAVRRLITERALEARPNRTIIVPKLSARQIEEVYKIRIELEGLAAQEAAAKVTDRDLAELRGLEEDMEAAQRDGAVRKYVDLNWRFHFKIYGLAGLPQLTDLIESLWLQIGPMINKQLAAFDHHQAAIDALTRRDAAAARQAIAMDLSEARDNLIARMRAEEAEAPPAPAVRTRRAR